MSTRDTISSHGPVHIFEECFSGKVCICFEPNFSDPEIYRLNSKYGVPEITLDELKKMHAEIGEYLERRAKL